MTTTFADLGIAPSLVAALDGQGIAEPFPIQALTIPDALQGHDVCGRAQTGSGKTLAFALPLLERVTRAPGGAPTAVVLVPTRELAVQVGEVLIPLAKVAGLRVATVYGGASMDKQLAAAQRGIDIVVATPGRLIDLIERKAISLGKVDIAVIDEADRMADFGFLPQVDWVMRQFSSRKPQVLLFSATLDGQVDSLVKAHLHDPVRHDVVSQTATVDEMTHRFLAVHQMDRVRVAASICKGASRTLLFVRTKRAADRVALQLQKERVTTGVIHGDLRQSARERALASFGEGKIRALVATDVAARGIHVDDVDVVIHYDPPEDHKAYLHRSGRTARAGQAGTVATFVLWNQVSDVERLQKRLGLSEPIVEVFSNDARLADLPSLSAAVSVAS